MKTALAWLALAVALSACQQDTSSATCADQASARGSEFSVAGAFTTTVAKVRKLQPGMQPARWPELSDDTPAVLCYLDGPFGDAPGGGQPYDRGAIAVAGEHADLVIIGYAAGMPVRSP